jgi:predicted nucleic acid-binding Zn ribbon protein
MPTYEFIDTETGEEFDRIMSWTAREEYLRENSNIKPLLSAPSIVTGVSGTSSTRVPDGFKEVLSKVAEKNPHTAFADKHGRRGIKEARTNEVVRKHVDKITKRIQSTGK